MENIKYTSNSISNYLSKMRIKWDHFYTSEKIVIENVFNNYENLKKSQVLDIGCGCGGLGIALKEKFHISNYSGVEINYEAAKYGQSISKDIKIIHGDFLKLDNGIIFDQYYDFVFSLSCIDWQLNFQNMFDKCWAKVKPGGFFILSLRLTNKKSLTNISESFQYANYDNKKEGEIAPYIVFNANEIFQKFDLLDPISMEVNGYFGKSNYTAICPYNEICFSVIALQKKGDSVKKIHQNNISLPNSIYKILSYNRN